MNIFLIVMSGLFGTLAMTLVMGLIHGMGLANCDMTRAIGSLYTGKYENSFWPGVVIQFSGGAIFAMIYAIIGGLAPIQAHGFAVLVIMTFIGIFHGIFMSLLLAVTVAEHHPLEQFRTAGPAVTISHLVGHIVYGFFVGLLFAVTQVDLKIISLS